MLFLKAFEMCRTRDFNCSHVSLVSNKALALLRNLPISDPALYEKLTYQQEPVLDKEEPAFTDEVEQFATDDIDIPTDDILIDHLLSDGVALEDGYAVDERGCIVRNNLAEHVDDVHKEDAAAAAALILLGRGHRKKMKPALYGGSNMWDM